MHNEFARRLIGWYASHARPLPWRGSGDPYAIWVSEIMLQQTRVETVTAYFLRWMERFPDIQTLAAASQQDVLSAWEGLGYYSRARNLQRAAQLVIERYGGRLPAGVEALRRLPGVGRYTAGAIASIAFGLDEPALDGNIRRVMARVFDVDLPASSPQGERRLWELAGEHLPAGKAGDYNQALMDLGATVCTPRAPACTQCPLQELCLAFARGVQEQRPVNMPRRAIPHFEVAAAVIFAENAGGTPHRVLIARRPADGLLGGMWEFPGGKQEDGEDLPACLRRELREELGVEVRVSELLGVYQHAYTHFRVTLHAFRCSILSGQPQPLQASAIDWAPLADLESFPMGKIDRQIARSLPQLIMKMEQSE
jgi:A/G-specific adenine glycosylase